MTTTQARRTLPLSEAGAEFWRHPSPWMLLTVLVGAGSARLVVGGWRWTDLLAPLVLLALFPFVEWLIHVFILHARPRRVGALTVDSLLARKHREHHADPRDIALIFIPWQTVAMLMLVLPVLPLVLFPRVGAALTLSAAMTGFALVYEWVHYLIHTDYRPRSAAYRSIHRHHRLHHFKNEHYWFTVTTAGTADRVLRTGPEPGEVQTSRTAKALHAA